MYTKNIFCDLQDVLHEKLGKARDTLNRKREKCENEHNQWIVEVIEMINVENIFYQCSLKLVYVFERRAEKNTAVLFLTGFVKEFEPLVKWTGDF